MNIQLSSELRAILEERLVYNNEFINDAVWFALENDEFKKMWLRRELQKGIDQADRGELFDLDLDLINAELDEEKGDVRSYEYPDYQNAGQF